MIDSSASETVVKDHIDRTGPQASCAITILFSEVF